MSMQTLKLDGKPYVLLDRESYDQLKTMAKSIELSPLPQPNKRGNYPAIEYTRASIAREIIQDRARLGLSQRELAQRAGIRVETLCRIETGKHTPSVVSIDKIDAAIKQVEKDQGGRNKTKRKKKMTAMA